jgi:DNA replication licensing factor MCM5
MLGCRGASRRGADPDRSVAFYFNVFRETCAIPPRCSNMQARERSGPAPAPAQAREAAKAGGSELPPVPITVRQLEAIVRIAESLARMQLQPEATQAHVRHAVDLFRVSTMDAVRSGLMDNLVRRAAARAGRSPAASMLMPGGP